MTQRPFSPSMASSAPTSSVTSPSLVPATNQLDWGAQCEAAELEEKAKESYAAAVQKEMTDAESQVKAAADKFCTLRKAKAAADKAKAEAADFHTRVVAQGANSTGTIVPRRPLQSPRRFDFALSPTPASPAPSSLSKLQDDIDRRASYCAKLMGVHLRFDKDLINGLRSSSPDYWRHQVVADLVKVEASGINQLKPKLIAII